MNRAKTLARFSMGTVWYGIATLRSEESERRSRLVADGAPGAAVGLEAMAKSTPRKRRTDAAKCSPLTQRTDAKKTE